MVENTQKVKDVDVDMVRDFQNFVGVDKVAPNTTTTTTTTEETPLLNEQKEKDDKLSWKIENAKREMQYLGTFPEDAKIEHDETGWEEAEARMNAIKNRRERSHRESRKDREEMEEGEEGEEEESASIPETLHQFMEQTREFAQARAVQIGQSMGILEPEPEPEQEPKSEKKKVSKQKESGEHKESLVEQTVGAVKEFITGFVETVTHGGGTDDDDE